MSYYDHNRYRPNNHYNGFESQQRYGYNDLEETHKMGRFNESQRESSPSFQRSPERYNQRYEEQQTGNSPIWQQLYRDGLNSKKVLLEQHQRSKNKIDIECTFQPIIKHNKRYLANSNSTFLERVHIWQEHKIEKMIKEKQEEVDKNLKECTFVPKINPAKKWQEHVETREQKSLTNIKSNMNRKINPYYSPIKKQPEKARKIQTQMKTPTKRSNTSYIELSQAKVMIRNELKRIAL